MARADLPKAVVDLIARHVDSAQQVEILLLLSSEPDRDWSADDVGRTLRIAERACGLWLTRFAAASLVESGPDGFRHKRAARPDRPTAVDELIDCYAYRRLTVLDLIYGKPDPAVQSFADAFRFRKDDD